MLNLWSGSPNPAKTMLERRERKQCSGKACKALTQTSPKAPHEDFQHKDILRRIDLCHAHQKFTTGFPILSKLILPYDLLRTLPEGYIHPCHHPHQELRQQNRAL